LASLNQSLVKTLSGVFGSFSRRSALGKEPRVWQAHQALPPCLERL
jgi:hypothetical protein